MRPRISIGWFFRLSVCPSVRNTFSQKMLLLKDGCGFCVLKLVIFGWPVDWSVGRLMTIFGAIFASLLCPIARDQLCGVSSIDLEIEDMKIEWWSLRSRTSFHGHEFLMVIDSSCLWIRMSYWKSLRIKMSLLTVSSSQTFADRARRKWTQYKEYRLRGKPSELSVTVGTVGWVTVKNVSLKPISF